MPLLVVLLPLLQLPLRGRRARVRGCACRGEGPGRPCSNLDDSELGDRPLHVQDVRGVASRVRRLCRQQRGVYLDFPTMCHGEGGLHRATLKEVDKEGPAMHRACHVSGRTVQSRPKVINTAAIEPKANNMRRMKVQET